MRATLLIVLTLGWATGAQAQGTTQFEELVGQAFEDLPQARAMRSQADAHDVHAGALEVWRDPNASLAISNVPWKELSLSRHPMSGVELKAMQPIPYPGKLEARSGAARAEADVTRSGAESLEIQLARMAVDPYFDLVEIEVQLPILRKQLALVEELVGLAQARYGARGAPASDALRGRLEKARIGRRIRVLEASRGRERARFNAALQRSDVAIEVPTHLPAQHRRDVGQLLALAEANRPEFVVIDRQVQAHRQAMRRERFDQKPDFSAGASWRFRSADDNLDGRDFFSVFFGVDLPIWSGAARDRTNAGHRALIDALDDQREAVRRDIRGRLSVLNEQIEVVEQELDAIRTTDIPEARIVREYLRAEYPTHASDFLAVLDAEQRLLELELMAAVLESRRARYSQEIRIETAEAKARH